MSKRAEILEGLRKGKSLEELAESLEMRKGTLRARIEQLEHRGFLRELSCDSACNVCPMRDSCPAPDQGREKIYEILEPEDPPEDKPDDA